MFQRTGLPFRTSHVPLLVAAIALLTLVDAVWAHEVVFTVRGLGQNFLQIAGLSVVATAYLSLRPNTRLAEIATYVILWAWFSTAALVLTYVCATPDLPLRDAIFQRCDHALGFDSVGWTRFLMSSPTVLRLLSIDYGSLIPQVAVTVFWLAHTRTAGRNAQFLSAAILSLVITSLVSAVLPATGPANNPVFDALPPFARELLAMRTHQPITRSLAEMQGIIAFPSFHTVLALLIVWAHRGLASFWPVAVLNGLMLLSLPAMGNHYMSDMIAGAAVAVLSLAATGQARGLSALPARPQESPAS